MGRKITIVPKRGKGRIEIEFYNKNDFEKNNINSKIIIQVHDELVIETVDTEIEQVKQLVKDAMELNQPLDVKLLVDVNVGGSWQES